MRLWSGWYRCLLGPWCHPSVHTAFHTDHRRSLEDTGPWSPQVTAHGTRYHKLYPARNKRTWWILYMFQWLWLFIFILNCNHFCFVLNKNTFKHIFVSCDAGKTTLLCWVTATMTAYQDVTIVDWNWTGFTGCLSLTHKNESKQNTFTSWATSPCRAIKKQNTYFLFKSTVEFKQ